MSEGAGLQRLRAARVVAVIRAPSADGAIEAAEAIVKGGLGAVEVTYSTPDTAIAIRELRRRHGDQLLVGAGTVRGATEVAPVLEAGAQFIVSPGIDEGVIKAGREADALVLSGALTPSEIMRALSLGAEAIKLFPAALGGPGLLRALREPFRDVAFVPTGGVSAENLTEWFASGAVAVAAGASLCPADEIAAGHFEEISERAWRFANAIRAVPEEGLELEDESPKGLKRP